ncbi:cytochrome aa3 quinol oxidase subunit II [Salinicoccus sp. ID82-1]|nr:cytochrome aa3 quinol oxidase subunit II [Salinicoccus sp. ID82-1]
MGHKNMYNKFPIIMLLVFISVLSGCSDLEVFDPGGPVAESQRDLIYYSLYFMAGIIIVVYTIFTIFVIRYRANRKNRKPSDYKPEMHGNLKIEIVWFAIPILIVTLLSIPTISLIFQLEEPPASSDDQEPLVVYATSADWKWIFSYPEENVETVNHLYIPTDRAIEFRLSSADSMASMWIPRLGGQKYNMAGMENRQHLQADEEGVFLGRNANFTGEGFAAQTFEVNAVDHDEFDSWVDNIHETQPELTQEEYDEILAPGLVDEMAFSSTHLEWVDHGRNEFRDYSAVRHADKYEEGIDLYNYPGFNPNEISE